MLAATLSVICVVQGYDYSNLQYLQEAPAQTPVTVPESATDDEINQFFKGADSDADGFLTKEEVKVYYTANNQVISDGDLDGAFT